MGTPVIVAVLAVVALIGAMVFVVATHDDAKPRSSAAGSDLVDSGSDGSGSLADSIDAEALTAQLKSFVPDTVDLAGIKGISREGARWQVVDEQTIPPSDTVPDCAPDVKPAQGGFGRQWGLGDADGHIHGQLVVTIVKYDTPADASAAVEARGAKAYEACYLAQREDELRETAGTDDVDPVVVTKKVAEASPSAALTRISTSEGFRVRGQACVHYIDASWRQVGARVIATDFSTCLNPFDPKAELQVEAAIAGQMQG